MTTSTILENYTELKKKSKTSHTAWFHFYNIFEMMNDKTTEMENRFTLSGLQGCGAGVGGTQGQLQKTVERTMLWTDALSLDGIPVS